jgi:signal transduction histidine kinase
MEGLPRQNPAHPLHTRREEIRRSLARINAASVVVVLVTIGLAAAAGWSAFRAERQAKLAGEANRRARAELWRSYLSQARAGRLSGVLGRKAAGLKAIAAAAAIQPSVELRNEAIAHLALLDFEPTGLSRTNDPGLSRATVDSRFERYAQADATGTIHIRRIEEPEDALVLSLPRTTNGFVAAVEFAPNGRLLAAMYENAALAIWNLESRTNVWSRADVAWADFHPGGTLLGVAGIDCRVRMVDLTSGEERSSFRLPGPAHLGAFDAEGNRLALVVGQKLEIRDWATGRLLEFWELDHPATFLAWGGNILAVGDRAGEVHLRDLVTRRKRLLQAHEDLVYCMAFSPRGDVLLSCSYDGSTKVWDPCTGRLLLTTTHGFGERFSEDGDRVWFRTQVGWSIWQVSHPEGFATLNCASGPDLNVWHVDFSRDGRWLAASKADGICVFRVNDRRRVLFQPANQTRVAYFLPGDEHLLASTTDRIVLWPIRADKSGSQPGFSLGEGQRLPLTNIVRLEFGAPSADRRRFAVPVSLTEVALLDLERRAELTRFTNGMVPRGPAFSPDGRWMATGTFHGRGTRVWDVATGQPVHDFNEGNASVCFSPDGQFLVSAGARLYQGFEAGTWRPVFHMPSDSGSELPNAIGFAGDGSLLAIVRERRRVELLQPGRWSLAAALIPPDPQVVNWVVFSPDNEQLAVATPQDRVYLWDLCVLRKRLAALGLDWNDPDAPVPTPVAQVAFVGANRGPWGVSRLGPVTMGALAAIAATLFIRHRQRRLLAAYREVEELAERRHLQLARAQSEMLHAQKMKALGTLAAGIAHDFNNLLSVIRMSNQLTAEAAPEHPEIRENSQEIEQAVQQGKKLVRSMLGYSREEIEDAQPFSLPGLVEDTVSLLSKQFLSGIVLTLDLDQEAPPVRLLSRSRLEQALLNLIVNAAEAMQGQGQLTIAARRSTANGGVVILRPRPARSYWELAVKDSGPGIAPELLARIFEPFFTTKNRGAERGTGLGLSMVYQVAEHDGLGIQVESKPGRGAEFRLILPVDD